MVQKLVNKVAQTFQAIEQSKHPVSVILDMNRFIQINNYSCGLVSAFVILNYYSKVNSINEILYDKRLLKQDGIDTEPLLSILKANGIKVHVNESADLDDIKSALIERKPVLISIRDGEHWVVVYGFSEDRVFILDSSVQSNLRCSMSYQEFEDAWDDNWIALVSNN